MSDQPRIPECPGEDPRYQFACQHLTDQGQYQEMSCDVGCPPMCEDLTTKIVRDAAQVIGRRWMRPKVGKTNRAADGVEHNLNSHEPLLVPRRIVFERAPCWSNSNPGATTPLGPGGEFFDMDRCDCVRNDIPDPVIPCDPPPACRCTDGTLTGHLLTGKFPDCWLFTGIGWSRNEGLDCRGVREHGPIESALPEVGGTSDFPLFQAHFARMTEVLVSHESPPVSACHSNVMVPCWAKVVTGHNCEICESLFCDSDNPPEWYFADQGGCREEMLGHVDIGYGSADDIVRILDSPDMPITDLAMIEAKNAALAAVRNRVFPDPSTPLGVRFDRLDHARGGTSSTHNRSLDRWFRHYDGGQLSCDELLSVYELPNSHTLYSRQPRPAELVATGVAVEMSLVPELVCHKDSHFSTSFVPCATQIWPHARFGIRITLAVRVDIPGVGCVLNPSAEDHEAIIYKDDQDRVLFPPPQQAEWRGYLGHSSIPATSNIQETEVTHSTVAGYCGAWINDLDGIQIPGWPYLKGSKPADPAQVYGGRITLNFSLPPECVDTSLRGALSEVPRPLAIQRPPRRKRRSRSKVMA